MIAGGNNVTGFGEVYLGDKADLSLGIDSRYRIEVESSEQNTGVAKPYGLYCQSGSGHTSIEMTGWNYSGSNF